MYSGGGKVFLSLAGADSIVCLGKGWLIGFLFIVWRLWSAVLCELKDLTLTFGKKGRFQGRCA